MTGAATPAPAPTYLLDTGIVLGFQKSRHLDALTDAGTRVSLALVEEVYDEITDPRNGKHAAAAATAKELIDASGIRRLQVLVGSPEAATLKAIRIEKTAASADLGEAASIALAVHEPNFVFVTNERAACFRAVRELCGRTLAFHPFLRALVTEEALELERADEIATSIQLLRDWQSVQPTWWQGWVTNLRVSSGAPPAESPGSS